MTSLNLLLVDDEQEFIEIMALRVRERGVNVSCAFSGREALERLAAEDAIDVVVLDVHMPGFDGMQTIEAIKTKHPLVEVIMLTGQTTVPSAIAALKLGAFDYLAKPCGVRILLEKAAKAAARKREREERILTIRMMPYITEREREELISGILEN